MNNATSQPPGNANRGAHLRKWKKWRNRLRLEFLNLLVKQRHFHELQALTKPYIGTSTAPELARSLAQGYAAFAFTAIRRLAEFPLKKTSKAKEIVSIPALLIDIQANAHLITRSHQRRRYKKAMKHLPQRIYIGAADRVHDAVANGDDVLQAASVESDLKRIQRTTDRISRLTNKVYAHIERDRRRIPRGFGFDELDEAIKILFGILRKYSLFIFGEEVVLPDIGEFSVAVDLRKIWPSNEPLPEFPSIREELEL